MTFTPRLSPRFSHWALRTAQGITAVSLAVALTACGGGDNNSPAASTPTVTSMQVVSFGDSLSDVGTYAPNIAIEFGGGRFTTNPGQVWTQDVATFYGGTLVAAQTGGFGAPVTNNPNGYGYGQGGALVTGEQGNGWAPNGAAALTVPVHDQVQNYIALHGSFNGNQLVLIQGGANDIIQGAESLQSDPSPANQLAVGTAVQKAATDLATLVGALLQAGATHVAVANVPNLAETPLTTLSASPAQSAAVFGQLVSAFNLTLAGTLTATGLMDKVAFLDTQTWLHNELGTFQADGFTVSNTATACNLTQMVANATASGQPDPSAFASALFCSPQTLVAPNADQTYMFADQVHPTTHLYLVFANYAESVINAKFGLK
jgi:phospholipase/lecithinase/hemolysin